MLLEHLFSALLTEGGNVFKDKGKSETQRIDLKDIKPTLKWLQSIVNLPMITLGSVGKKASSGDLDIAVDAKTFSKESVANKLIGWCKANNYDSRKFYRSEGKNIHFKAPIKGDPANGFVQVDFVFGNIAWLKFLQHAEGDASKFTGADRYILMNCIARYNGLRMSPDGLLSVTSERIIAEHPDTIAEVLLGPGHKESDLASVETIMRAIYQLPNRDEILEVARESFANHGTPLPTWEELNSK